MGFLVLAETSCGPDGIKRTKNSELNYRMQLGRKTYSKQFMKLGIVSYCKLNATIASSNFDTDSAKTWTFRHTTSQACKKLPSVLVHTAWEKLEKAAIFFYGLSYRSL